MLSRLYFKPSTYKTLYMEAQEGIAIIHIPVIFPLPMPPKATLPPSTSLRTRNMCHQQSLSTYQLKPQSFPSKDISTFSFVLAIRQMLTCSSFELLLFSLSESSQMTIKLFFSCDQNIFFSSIGDTQLSYVQVFYIQSI